MLYEVITLDGRALGVAVLVLGIALVFVSLVLIFRTAGRKDPVELPLCAPAIPFERNNFV